MKSSFVARQKSGATTTQGEKMEKPRERQSWLSYVLGDEEFLVPVVQSSDPTRRVLWKPPGETSFYELEVASERSCIVKGRYLWEALAIGHVGGQSFRFSFEAGCDRISNRPVLCFYNLDDLLGGCWRTAQLNECREGLEGVKIAPSPDGRTTA
jgi:hypothetical protein